MPQTHPEEATGVRLIPVRLTENGEKFSDGKIQVQFWNKKERTARALKFGGLCWGGAVIAVILPLVHFVLVPGLLIAGPLLAWNILSKESVVLGGEGSCPNCGKTVAIARAPFKFPILDLCTNCHRELRVEARREGTDFVL